MRRSGRREHHVDARRNPEQLAASLQAMQQPHAGADRDEHAEHHQAERTGEIAEHGAEGMTQKIADRDKARRPQPSGGEIQAEKAIPLDCAQTQRERREIAHAINEAERQDEPGIVALEPAQGAIDAVAPAREAIEQFDSELAAEPEIELVAGKAAKPRRAQQQERIHQALGYGEPGEDDDGLAFEKGPEKDDAVKTRAVLRNELVDINIHRRLFLTPSPCSGRPAVDGAAPSRPARQAW